MTRRERWTVALGLGLLALTALFVALRFKVTTDINDFLPEGQDRALSTLSRQVADSELSRTMVLVLGAAEGSSATEASVAFEAALRADPAVAEGIAFLEGGPTEGTDRALFELYEPRRLAFFAADADAARAGLTDEALAEAATHLRDELSGPMSPLVARVAPRDPFLILPGLFHRLAGSRAQNLSIEDGRFVAQDGRSAVLFLGTKASAFNAETQAPLLAGITRAFDATNARFGGALSLDQSGLNRFATRAATAIESDIERVSTFATLLLGGLLLYLFRSARFLALASLPVGAGVIVGAAVVLALFGRLHGITVAFGASLIGVSIDYVVHLYTHHAVVAPPDGGRGSVRQLGPALATGAATTVVGFAALGGSALAGLREVACFAASGIIAAFLVTRFVLPPLFPRRAKSPAALERFVRKLGGLLRFMRAHRRGLAIVPLAALALIAVGLPSAHLNDDFASLGRLDPALLEEDARVRAQVTRYEQMRFVVALGADEAAALEANDRVARALDAAVEAGELDAFRSVASLLPSPAQQRAVSTAVRDSEGLGARVEAAFAEAGFAAGAFAPFMESLSGPAPEPLRFDALLDSPLASMVRPFRVALGERVGFVTFVHGVSDIDALAARFEGDDAVVLLRQADLLGQAHRDYQESTLWLLGAGLLAVFALLGLRYREPRRTLASFTPALLAAGVTLSVLTLTGRGLDLVTLTALLFVISMGVDFGVFLVDASDDEDSRELSAAMTSVFLDWVSTAVGFGLLGLSDHPVLASLGITASAGITACLLLAPTALFLLRPDLEAEEATT